MIDLSRILSTNSSDKRRLSASVIIACFSNARGGDGMPGRVPKRANAPKPTESGGGEKEDDENVRNKHGHKMEILFFFESFTFQLSKILRIEKRMNGVYKTVYSVQSHSYNVGYHLRDLRILKR